MMNNDLRNANSIGTTIRKAICNTKEVASMVGEDLDLKFLRSMRAPFRRGDILKLYEFEEQSR